MEYLRIPLPALPEEHGNEDSLEVYCELLYPLFDEGESVADIVERVSKWRKDPDDEDPSDARDESTAIGKELATAIVLRVYAEMAKDVLEGYLEMEVNER